MPVSAEPFADAIGKLDFPSILARIARSCFTPLGEEKILSLRPSSVFAEVRDELQRVREMMTLLARDEIPDLQGVRDVRESLHRAAIEGSVLGGEALRHLYLFLR